MAIYDKLDALGLDYKRADHDHADTMKDCLAIEKVLGAKHEPTFIDLPTE